MKARVFLPAILSGVLLWAAFFPLDLGPVAFVALAPFLTLVRAEGIGPWRRYLAAFVGGLTFYLLALQWIRVAHPMMELFAWPALSIACALFWPAGLLLLRKLDRLGLPFVVTLPVVWVGLEYVRTHLPTGFPFLSHVGAYQLVGFGWYHLGYTQHRVEPLIQAADLGGVYVVSAAVAAVNGAAYEWLVRSRLVRRLLRWPAPAKGDAVRELWVTAGAVAVPLALVAYGAVTLAHPAFGTGPRVAAIQGNLSQSEKMTGKDQASPGEPTPLEGEYYRLAAQAVRGDPGAARPDLVVWPETCFPQNWEDLDPGLPPGPETDRLGAIVVANQVDFVAEARKKLPPANMLLGLNRREWADELAHRRYNSAVLLRANGTVDGRYDKMHLVPFGEYVPLRGAFPWLRHFTPYGDRDYSCTPGEAYTRFTLPAADGVTYHFGVLICYEDTDPYLARQYNPAAGGEGVDFLVNTSNDGWFDGTEEHEQHLAICRFRAVESRRAVVRAVNMGISAVIDPDGRVVALPVGGSWAKSKKTRGIVRADVPIDGRETVYAAVGDLLPGLCWLGIAAGLVAIRVRGRQDGATGGVAR